MKSTERVFRVDREEINYIRTIVESYDGMAVVRTVDPREALISVMIAPGCEKLVIELLDDLRNNEGLLMTKVETL
ncbi:DUF4911 domain-containing protein [Thermodesulfobacteriota bacterium]